LRIEAILASDLISTGQCKEGMELVKGLEKKIRPGDVGKYGCLMCAAASGYACLGDMDKAVESMDKLLAKSNDFVRTRTYLKALYLYQAGKKEEALTALNASINADPTFIGDRYYLRSLIYLERGDRQQAIDDLGMGERYTWDRYGLYAYVNAKLALEDGNKEDAIYWLQIAEASLFPESSMLKKQIQEELSQLGAKPLDRVVTIDFQGTPMPPVTPIP
jgi:tetratricopeptide (TPR) repeat protein